MRRTHQFLLATMILAAPMPVAAQVSVDFNALNGLGRAELPAPPPAAPTAVHRRHHGMRHLAARAEHGGRRVEGSAVATATHAPAGPETVEHPANLGSSFASLPALPGAVPPTPAPPPVLPAPGASKAAAPKPVETAIASPKPPAKPEAAPLPASPQLALPGAVPPPPPTPMPTPSRLAEATPAPPAAAPPQPAVAPDALPKGADRLTLPFFVQQSDLPPAENAMLRDFTQRYSAAAQYIVRAFATAPAGDDDPSTPRRIALARAQSVASALLDSGVPPDRVRLLALGSAGGTPADRVEVIAMPPSSGHTDPQSSP